MSAITYFDEIKWWDMYDSEKHVHNLCANLKGELISLGVREVYMMDIGANVGKVYDLLKRSESVFFSVKKCWMYEPSDLLCNYIIEKYRKNEDIKIFNYALSDKSEKVFFDQRSMLEQIEWRKEVFNFGLSRITEWNDQRWNLSTARVQNIIKLSLDLSNSVNFIKIDTENNDYPILNGILEVIDLFKTKPVISFENNWKMNKNLTEKYAQEVLDGFVEKGYYYIKVSDLKNKDGLLTPKG